MDLYKELKDNGCKTCEILVRMVKSKIALIENLEQLNEKLNRMCDIHKADNKTLRKYLKTASNLLQEELKKAGKK